MRNVIITVIFFISSWLVWTSCSTEKDPVVAKVGEKRITVSEYDRMATKLLENAYYKDAEINLETKHKLLDTMISKELLVLEGLEKGLDQESDIARPVDRLRRQLLLKTVYDREAVGEIELSDEEVERYFYEGEFDDEIRTSHILCSTEEVAEEVLGELRDGASFEKLAMKRSLHRSSGRRGGDMGFRAKGILMPELREQMLSLDVGELYPRPVKSEYGFHVFKVTDRRNPDFQIVKPYIAKGLEQEKRRERIAGYDSTLKAQYGLTCHVDALHLLLERGKDDSSMADSERTMELFTWSGGRLSIEDYLDRVGSGLPSVMDSAAVRASGEKLTVRRIALIEAHKKGYDKDKNILSQVEQKRNELIAKQLHRIEAVEKVSVTEADLRAFYEEHPDESRVPAAVMLQEILVKTEEEAKRLIEQIQNGADMGALARQHSLRSGTRERGGKTRPVTRDNPQFGPVAQVAFDAPIGVLQGPVQVPAGFSIFKVLDRREERMRSFEEVRRTLEAVARAIAGNEAMDRFFESLKEKYASRIKVYEEALEHTLSVKRDA
jgi:peptidyl-prolyl cis-trans isomerase C